MTNARMPHASLSDVGQRRDHNEDAVLVDPPVMVVADGVGGSAKGEVASNLAIETFATAAVNVVAATSTDDALQAMQAAILAANAAIHESQLQVEARRGMATTITAAAVRDGGEIVVGHVGDSRLYVLSAAGARQVSEDHSVVAELLRSGRIDAEEAAHHPQRNVITRALGPDDDVAVDTFVVHAGPGDWLLACSDGLTAHVEDHEIAVIVIEHGRDPDRAAKLLIDLANSRGGSDNITVALVQPVPSDVSGELRIEELHAAAATTLPRPLAASDAPAEASGPMSVVADEGDAPASRAGGEVSSEMPELEPLDDDDQPSEDDDADDAERNSLLLALGVITLLVVAIAVLWSQCSFLAVTNGDTLTVRQGLPYAGLSRHAHTSDLPQAEWGEEIDEAVERERIFFGDGPTQLVDRLHEKGQENAGATQGAVPQ